MIFLAVIIIIPGCLFIALQFSDVQTYLVNRITSRISDQIKSTISTGRIEFRFFNKLSIYDVLIKDFNHDTLLFSRNVNIGINGISLRNRSVRIGRVNLDNPVVTFVSDSSGVMNLTRYLDLLKKTSDTTGSKGESFVSIDQIDINDGRFGLISNTGPRGKTRIGF